VLEWPSRAEAALLRAGVGVPFGLSLLAVLRAADVAVASRPHSHLSIAA
jgi:hypothetical protein